MASVRDIAELLAEHADQRLPAGFYVAISVPTERIRGRLRRHRKPFLDPDAGATPGLPDVDETASWVIAQSSVTAATLGGMASFVGAVSVPPEALASAVSILRLAQRLAVVYGFDPETDKGQMAVWKALAAGLELDLPSQGPMQVRMRDLPMMLVPHTTIESAGAALTRAVVARTAWLIAGRLSRLVPVVSPGISAYTARRRMKDTGARMKEALRRLVELPPEVRFVEDALEVP